VVARRTKNKRIIHLMNTQRIGIYAGAFDPVHSGHVSFALQALEEAQLEEVYFLPERKPRYKPGAEHYGHRVAMLRQAVQPHSKLQIVEVVDRQLTVNKTFRQLRQVFGDVRIVFLMGADAFASLPDWSGVDKLIPTVEFIVAVRSEQELTAVNTTIQSLHIPPASIKIVDSLRPEVSGAKVRYAIRRRQYVSGLLESVLRYAKREWLYATIRSS
jgi:nicotinate-nucleotide adenylyltransferase